jgi:5S rRNA maturation endonuclease (ribonuclease M5)
MFDTHDRILEIANQFLRGVRRTGSENLSAICPIHRKPDGSPERSPSFTLSLVNGMWQCWSCKEKGTLQRLITLVSDGYHVTKLYEDLFEDLRKQRALERPAYLASNYVTNNPLPEAVLGFFDKCPLTMLDEGFTEETLRRFEVGFDEKHLRVTFPIRDIDGTLMGVSGRTVVDDVPRHKVYDVEYEAYGLIRQKPARKSMTLWNGHTLYPALVSTFNPEPIVVVEGFKACMWLWQAGIKNVVALLGSTLSRVQKWLLERIGAPVYLMSDNDAAGRKARREIGEQLAASLPLYVVEYEYNQPSDIPPGQLNDIFNKSQNYYNWAVNKALEVTPWAHSAKIQTT